MSEINKEKYLEQFELSQKKYGDKKLEVYFNVCSYIELFGRILERCNFFHLSREYLDYMSSVRNYGNMNMVQQKIELVNDFWNYFYTNKHICHFNYRELHKLDNNYGISNYKLNLYDIIKQCDEKEYNIIIEVIDTAFSMCKTYRDILELPIYEGEQHKYLISYRTDITDPKYKIETEK